MSTLTIVIDDPTIDSLHYQLNGLLDWGHIRVEILDAIVDRFEAATTPELLTAWVASTIGFIAAVNRRVDAAPANERMAYKLMEFRALGREFRRLNAIKAEAKQYRQLLRNEKALRTMGAKAAPASTWEM